MTVHAYAPPLKDFCRFVPRPVPPVAHEKVSSKEPMTVVFVGGGFSGSMTAAQLLRKAKSSGVKLRVVVVERRAAAGEGAAYVTRELTHLLNVPAAKVSAWTDRPDNFLNWVAARDSKVSAGVGAPAAIPEAYLEIIPLSYSVS